MILYRILWWLVLLPTFLVSGFFWLMGLAALLGMATEGTSLGRGILAALLLFGGFGLISLSRLDAHCRNGAPLGDLRIHLAGLVAGSLTSLALLLFIPDQRLSLWPLLAVGYFLVRLRGWRRAP